MNSKSNVFYELIFLIIIVVTIGIIVLPLFEIVQEFNTEIQNEDMSQEAKDNFNNVENNFPTMIDYGFLLLVIFFWVAMLISSYMIDAQPIFLIIFIILIAITLILGAEFSNMYLEYGEEFQTDKFPIMTHFFNNIVLYLVVIGFSVSTVMFAKIRGSS